MSTKQQSPMGSELSEEEFAEIAELRSGGMPAQTEFFESQRRHLKTIAKFRIDPRLRRRVSDSDIIQEAFIKFNSEIDSYLVHPRMPPKVWLRRLLRQIVWRVNRHHIGAQCRDLRREQDPFMISPIDLEELADSLSSLGSNLDRIALRTRLHEIVSGMPKLEREILTLVHFEEQTVREAALELDINYEAAKKRYRRSLQRLKDAYQMPLQNFVR